MTYTSVYQQYSEGGGGEGGGGDAGSGADDALAHQVTIGGEGKDVHGLMGRESRWQIIGMPARFKGGVKRASGVGGLRETRAILSLAAVSIRSCSSEGGEEGKRMMPSVPPI